MGSQDNAFIKNNLQDYLDSVELTAVEHQMLRSINKRCDASNQHRVQLNCKQLQEITYNRYSLESIEIALDILCERRIINAYTDGSLGPNLFFWEWIMRIGSQQQLKTAINPRSDRQSHATACDQSATTPTIH